MIFLFEIERKYLFIRRVAEYLACCCQEEAADIRVLNPAGWQDHRRPNLHHISKTEPVPEIQTAAPSLGVILFSSVARITELMAWGHIPQNLSIILTSLAPQERPG